MKIISYTLYGNNSRYIEPLIFNVKSINEFYQGWSIRVYHDNSVNLEILNLLKDFNVKLINIIYENEYIKNLVPKFWRFLPVFENQIDAVIFRDADSIFSHRESKLVNEWLLSDKSFHIIRDHSLHISPIMAGMFGIKKPLFNLFINELNNASILSQKNKYNSDQLFLADYLYLKVIEQSLLHTSYFAYCNENFIRIEKSHVENEFIGAVHFKDHVVNKVIIVDYDFIIGIPFQIAKILRYRIRPVLYLSLLFYFISKNFKRL